MDNERLSRVLVVPSAEDQNLLCVQLEAAHVAQRLRKLDVKFGPSKILLKVFDVKALNHG